MIALVKINNQAHSTNPPLGLLYVGNALKQAGYDVKIYHITDNEIDKYSKTIVDKKPLFVGFSVFTAGMMRKHADMCKQIKTLDKDIKIIWGNAHPSLLPEQCLNEKYIDYICVGEGEETIVEFAEALEGKRDLESVLGIGYKDQKVHINERRPFIKDLDKYRLEWDLVDIERYIKPYYLDLNRVLEVVTSRGCPHACGFCYNLAFNQRKWRAHSIEYVVNEIGSLISKYELNGIMFRDDNFFVNKRRAFEIVRRLGVPYSAECRVDYIDEEMVENLVATGCRELLLGLESGCKRILDLMNKQSSPGDITKAVKLLSKTDISVSGSVIFASPTETKDEFRQTVSLMVELLDIHPKMAYTTGWFLPYPGTDLYELAKKEGFLPPQRTEDWDALDRWTDKMELTWIDWAAATEIAEWRGRLKLLSFAYRNNIPFLKSLLKYRILRDKFLFPLDVKIVHWLYRTFSLGREKPIIKFVRKLVVHFRKLKKNLFFRRAVVE